MFYRLAFAVAFALVVTAPAFAQDLVFDAVVPITVPDPSISGCLYNTATTRVLASVVMPAAGPIDLTVRFPTIPLQRTFANPLCPAARNLQPHELRLAVPRNASAFVQYYFETNGPGTDLLGTGESGNVHFGVWIYFCADDGAQTCTWTTTRTNRVLVSLYYRFDKTSPSSIIRFAGQYLGPNPGRLPPVAISAPLALPLAITGDAYGPVNFTATGGAPPYSWSASSLPAGLALTTTGGLSGIAPDADGRYPFDVRVRDGVGQTATRSYELLVSTSLCTRDGCLASATRQRLIGAVAPPDGCSVPSIYHARGIGRPLALLAAVYTFLFKPACDQHDLAYSDYAPYAEFQAKRAAADQKFLTDMQGICGGLPSVFRPQCATVAQIFHEAVVRFGEENFLEAQYRESFCPNCPTVSPDADSFWQMRASDAPAQPSPTTVLVRGMPREHRGSVSALGTTPLAAVYSYSGVSGQFYTRSTPTTVDEAIRVDGVQLVERSTAAFVRYQIPPTPVPPSNVVDFAFAVLGQGDGDWLSATLDGTVLWAGQTRHFQPDVVYLAHLPAAALVGGGVLQFTLHGVAASNAVVLLGDPSKITFGFGEPDAPRNPRAAVDGSTVTIAWDPVTPTPTHHIIEASLSPGGAAAATIHVGPATSFTTGAPPGRYWVRVLAANDVGSGPPSTEVEVVVSSCSLPAAPASVHVSATGPVATITWLAIAGLEYIVEVGTSAGMSNLGVFPLPTTGTFSAHAPPGTYYVRLRASNACGVSPPSQERVVTLPNP